MLNRAPRGYWKLSHLATSHPVFIVSERVGAVLAAERLTGFRCAEMEQSVDEQALAVLRSHAQLSLCDVEPWTPGQVLD